MVGPRGQDVPADVLIMCVAGLDLLRDRMHVAETPFELVRFEDRGGAGHVIGRIHYGSRLMDRPGRGKADGRPPLLG
jgi:hypothetical protein